MVKGFNLFWLFPSLKYVFIYWISSTWLLCVAMSVYHSYKFLVMCELETRDPLCKCVISVQIRERRLLPNDTAPELGHLVLKTKTGQTFMFCSWALLNLNFTQSVYSYIAATDVCLFILKEFMINLLLFLGSFLLGHW